MEKWPPPGKRIVLPVIKDTWISAADQEKFANNGGADKLKLKGRQEFFLFDFDTSGLKGKIITGARLHICSASSKTSPFARVGISTLAASWEEGRSTSYRPQKGSACYAQAKFQEKDWAYQGSSIMDVAFGHGHTIWKYSDCARPDEKGWQSCSIEPDVVASKVSGISHGFFVYDELGSEWSLKKGQFKYNGYPNRYCYSREKRGKAPWVEIWIQGEDTIPPDPVQEIGVETKGMVDGEAVLVWETPVDKGGSGILGFNASFKRNGKEKKIPRYMIPMAGPAGGNVKMYLRDMGFNPGEKIEIIIWPVDSTGNVGKPFSKTIQTASNINLPQMPQIPHDKKAVEKSPLPVVDKIRVSVVDLLDKVDPVTGKMLPDQKDGYKSHNHLYSALDKKVTLCSAKNEHVFFQLNLEGRSEDIQIKYSYDSHPGLKPKVFEFAYVKVSGKDGSERMLPDPLVPFKGSVSIPSKQGKVLFDTQTNHSLICQLYVPHAESPGKKHGRLEIRSGGEDLSMDVELTVLNFTLPNKLSFVPEMNVYGKSIPLDTYEHYRMAHEHRTCINRLPYGWSGRPYLSPGISNFNFDWKDWDKKAGPLLDGSAFKGLPRDKEPVDVFYLPFNENWPVNIFDNYTPSYWADQAFTSYYRQTLKRYFGLFAQHAKEKEWTDTIFQFYLNNKVYRRKNYKLNSAPWVFDEPLNTQDFLALRWYGLVWKEAVGQPKSDLKLWFRGDISNSEFKRDMLKGIMDIEYVGHSSIQKTKMRNEEIHLWGKSYFAEYGTANPIISSNVQPAVWCLSAWTKGAMGVVPWQTIGQGQSWIKAEQTSLFYPHSRGPKASVRLKSFTRGQQDVEYLVLAAKTLKVPLFRLRNWIKSQLAIQDNVVITSAKDAGTAVFDNVMPRDLWRIRLYWGKMVSKMGPGYEPKLTAFNMPVWDQKKLSRIGHATPAPKIEPVYPDCDSFRPDIK